MDLDPEVAHVGITEAQARESGINYSVYKHQYADVDRALTDGVGVGFVKIITTGWRGKIIGSHLIGSNAGELIAELSLANTVEQALAVCRELPQRDW